MTSTYTSNFGAVLDLDLNLNLHLASGLGTGLDLDVDLDLDLDLNLNSDLSFCPRPAALLDNFPTIQTSHGAKHHLPRSDDRPRRWLRKTTDGRVFDSSFPRPVDV